MNCSIRSDKMRWVHIMKKGEYYETGVTAAFHTILGRYDSSVRPAPLVIDIGMNIGWFSLYSRAHGHDVAGERVINSKLVCLVWSAHFEVLILQRSAFEPNKVMFLRVCESLQYNNWENDNTVSLWNYGLGAQAGSFNLTTGNNPGGSSFHEDRLAPKFRKKMTVEVATLDSVAIQEGWLDRQVSLLKVDVEGFENFVFEGGKRLIYNGNVENIFMVSYVSNVFTLSQRNQRV